MQPISVSCGPLCRLAGLQHVEMVRRTFQEEEMAQAEAQRLDRVDMLGSREKPEWLESWKEKSVP